MALTYSTYINEVSKIVATDPSDQNFASIIPGMIDYAEQRIYRELDLLNTVTVDNTSTLVPLSRNFTLPTTSNGNFITIQGLNLITPAGTTATTGIRNAVQPTTRDYLDTVWNSTGGSNLPIYFAMIDQFKIGRAHV